MAKYDAIGTMNTRDGKIDGTVRFNPAYKMYQVSADGAPAGEFKDLQSAIDELKRMGFKNIKQNTKESVNLKENYERFFGKMTTENKLGHRISAPNKPILTESEQNRFHSLQKVYQKQYPMNQLRLKEGYVMVNNMIVEKIETFIKKNNNQIIQILKSYSR